MITSVQNDATVQVATENQYLMTVAIGPVQDFISRARTLRDLWTGSYILSYLAKQAAIAAQEAGAILYYPQMPGEAVSLSADFPNKFTLLVDKSKVAEVGDVLEKTIHKIWLEIADSVKNFIYSLDGILLGADWKVWDKQQSSWLEVFWAAIPLTVDTEIKKALTEATFALEARKRVRNFTTYEGNSLEKDTIDGIFEQIGLPALTREKHIKFWENLRNALRTKGAIARLNPNERLSAVNLTKRFAWERYFEAKIPKPKADESKAGKSKMPIPSTADVATAYWREKLKNQAEFQPKIKAYLAVLQEFLKEIDELPNNPTLTLDIIDCRYLYEEALAEQLTQDKSVSTKAQGLAKKLQGCLKDLNKAAGSPPPRYYAVLMLDGDRMGKLFSGGKEQPAKYSQALGKYAKEVKTIVKEHKGFVVYTGGDDVLALLPTQEVLRCAVELREAFPLLSETTVSMGIAVAHYKHPLQRVLDEARSAEHAAKNRFGRDALAIHVLKRSGEIVTAGQKWEPECSVPKFVVSENPTQHLAVFDLLYELQQYFALDETGVSLKLPYRLRQETQLLSETTTSELRDLLVAEFRRLYKRQTAANIPDEETKQIAALGEKLAILAYNAGDFNNFANLLLVAAFLAREHNER